VLPGVTIEATANSATQTTVSGSDGSYSLPPDSPANCAIVISDHARYYASRLPNEPLGGTEDIHFIPWKRAHCASA
jgi:hypothetical protein